MLLISRILLLLWLILFTHLAMAEDFARLGWPQTLNALHKQLKVKQKNFVIVISRLPSIPVDFRSEEGLKNSINSLHFQNSYHPGHVMIGWKCRIGETTFDSMLGLSGELDDQHTKLLKAGWGLTSLLATFKDGYIQTPDQLESRFQFFNDENLKSEANGEKNKISLIATALEISEDDCVHLVDEVYRFVDHPNNPAQNFSMILSPRNYEGAGCGSFVTHLLEQIPSLKPVIRLFQRTYRFPNYLFGTGAYLPTDVVVPQKIASKAINERVSEFRLLSSFWTSSRSPNIEVDTIDPELIVFWQKLFFDTYFEQNNLLKQKKSFNKQMERGLWPQVEDMNNPGYYVTRYVTINKDYDQKTEEINWHYSQLAKDSKLSYFTFSNYPGIIFEKK